jgi:hypothetical protein
VKIKKCIRSDWRSVKHPCFFSAPRGLGYQQPPVKRYYVCQSELDGWPWRTIRRALTCCEDCLRAETADNPARRSGPSGARIYSLPGGSEQSLVPLQGFREGGRDTCPQKPRPSIRGCGTERYPPIASRRQAKKAGSRNSPALASGFLDARADPVPALLQLRRLRGSG